MAPGVMSRQDDVQRREMITAFLRFLGVCKSFSEAFPADFHLNLTVRRMGVGPLETVIDHGNGGP